MPRGKHRNSPWSIAALVVGLLAEGLLTFGKFISQLPLDAPSTLEP